MAPPIYLVVSIDTEEDNWNSIQNGITLENIRELSRHHAFLGSLRLRPTYYPVLSAPWAAEIVHEIGADGNVEVGAHLHPWNTPPFEDEFMPRHTMLKNLPYNLQLARVEALRNAFEQTLGAAPTSFRAGRFGRGASTIAVLIKTGFRVDSSIIPFVSLEFAREGAGFVGAPMSCYASTAEMLTPVPEGGVPGKPAAELALEAVVGARGVEGVEELGGLALM